MDRKGQRDPATHLKEPNFEETETPLSPVSGSPKEENLWEYPFTQEQLVRTLTQAYAPSLIFPSFTLYLRQLRESQGYLP